MRKLLSPLRCWTEDIILVNGLVMAITAMVWAVRELEAGYAARTQNAMPVVLSLGIMLAGVGVWWRTRRQRR